MWKTLLSLNSPSCVNSNPSCNISTLVLGLLLVISTNSSNVKLLSWTLMCLLRIPRVWNMRGENFWNKYVRVHTYISKCTYELNAFFLHIAAFVHLIKCCKLDGNSFELFPRPHCLEQPRWISVSSRNSRPLLSSRPLAK